MESASALHCPDAKRNLLDDLNRFDMTEEHLSLHDSIRFKCSLRAENTLLPAPSEKEVVAVFLRFTNAPKIIFRCHHCVFRLYIWTILIRVKPRTSHERAIMKENWGEQGEKEDEEVTLQSCTSNPDRTNPIQSNPILIEPIQPGGEGGD